MDFIKKQYYNSVNSDFLKVLYTFASMYFIYSQVCCVWNDNIESKGEVMSQQGQD